MPRRPTGWTLALAVALPAEAATTLTLPPALAGAVDAALERDAGGSAFGLLALVLGTAAAANALAAAAGPACAAEATAALRDRLVRHLLDLGPGGRLRHGGPPPGDLTARLIGSAADAGGRLRPRSARPPRCSPRSARPSASGCSRPGWRSPSAAAWCPGWC